jgi:hypothetical protein
MSQGQLCRIARVAQLLELHAFHNPSAGYVETRDDSFGQHPIASGIVNIVAASKTAKILE